MLSKMTGKPTWNKLILIVFILPWISSANPYPSCIKETNVERKQFFYNDEPLNIRILTSSRLTHKIVSSIFQVFSEQVLGYANVSLVEIDDPRLIFEPDVQISNISSCQQNE